MFGLIGFGWRSAFLTVTFSLDLGLGRKRLVGISGLKTLSEVEHDGISIGTDLVDWILVGLLFGFR